MKVFTKALFLLSTAALAHAPAWAQQVTPIGVIQGSGVLATSGTYTVDAVVTAVYPGLSPAGFYVQNQGPDADNDPATSDALFVVQSVPTVAVGNKLRITGPVQEIASTPSFNQAVLTSPTITVLAASSPLPAFAVLNNAAFSVAGAEQYEGMRVQFSAPVTVSDVASLKSRGELSISPRGLLYQPTQFVDPNDDPATGTSSSGTTNVPAVNAYQAANLNKLLVLDDGRAATNPSPIPYLDPATQTVRVGSTIAGLRGILGYGGSRWRVQPLAGPDAPVLTVLRPAVPTFGPIDVKLASYNVLNYFNGDGQGGGFPTSRGALTLTDFNRQRSKILAGLAQMNADVVGLIEIENDGTGPNSAIQDIVNGLNQRLGAGTYAFVDDGGPVRQPFNSDLIHCAILYKPAVLTPYGPALLATATGIFERPPIAQVFTTNLTAARDTFAVVVNHFKAKSSGSGINADQGDGQGASNFRRKTQATALVQFIDGTVRLAGGRYVVSVGDYNANFEEDPMDILRAAGFALGGDAGSTSYVFNGLSGALDHAVLSANLMGHAAVAKWHINASEPEFLEYSVAGAATDINSPFRSSDHDPILVGLNFRATVTGAARAASGVRLQAFPNPAAAGFTLRISGADTHQPLTLEVVSALGQRVLTLHGTAATLPAECGERTARLPAGPYLLRLSGAGSHQVQRVVKE